MLTCATYLFLSFFAGTTTLFCASAARSFPPLLSLEQARFSAVLLGQGSTAASSSTSSYQAMSPNSPTFPVNSGFVVTSRPNSQILGGHPASQQRSAAGYNQQHYVSPTMSAAPGHGRSLSSHGWSHAAETTSATHRHHSPTHSRNASDSLSGSSSSHNQSLLGRVPSNASTSSNHARPTTGSTNSNHNSTPSPASPIDTSLLGQNNPWSPTAEERLHFRELSSTLNLASLRQPDPSSSNGLTDGIIESSISPGPISPPSSKRSSGLKGNNTSSPRRAHSLNLHGKGFRPKPIEEPVPQVSPASALPPSSIRQPQRKNTPVLPPLVTSSEALVNAAFGGSDNYATELSNRSNDQQTSQAQLANSINPTGGASFVQNGTDRQEAGANGKIIRGPASAAPYVPPIGHTHLSDKSGTSYGIPTVPIGPPLPHHEQSGRTADQVHGAAPSLGLSHVNHMRGFNTAGPGLPENIYLQERARIAGSSAMQHGQQYDIPSSSQYRNQQQQQDQHQQAISQYPQNSQATSIAVPLSPNGATNLNSAVAMHFPSLHSINDAANAAAFTTNLHLQQQLLVQQTQQLHEQQNQLANALANGLILQDQRIMHEDADLHQSGQMPGATPSLPTTPSGLPVQQKTLGNFQQQHDPYTISAKIEALQRANAMLVAAMSDPNAHHPTQLVQQVHDLSHQPPRAQPFQQFGNGLPNGPHGAYIQPFRQYTPGQSVDLGRPTSAVNGQGQQHLASVSPVDIHALTALKGYNPQNFDVRPTQARFFVIKSFTEDDVFKSIKFEIWSSTVLGNNRLDKAFSESSEKGPIYLFFSVNASGHFCGVAEMLTPLDYSVTSNVWAQGDKWKGVMSLRWIYIKDIPNPALRHLKLMNTNEQKPVTSSRDTQEVPYEQGCEMLRIFSTYQSKTSLLQGNSMLWYATR